MKTSDLYTASKAIKLRHFDKDTNSKILLDVKWLQLKGNKHPYLSVDVRRVKSNGVSIEGYSKERIAIMKGLNLDFAFLAESGCCNLDGSGMHQVSNVHYHFKLAKDSFGKYVYTSEDHQQKLSTLKDNLDGHPIFKTLFKELGHSKDKYLKEYLNTNGDLYQYFNSDRAFNHWNPQFKKNFNGGGMLNRWGKSFKSGEPTPENHLKNFFDTLQELKKLREDFKYKTLPSVKDVWTPDRLAKVHNIPLEQVFYILSNVDMEPLIKPYSDMITATRYAKLKELTIKYKIPLVIEN